MPVAGSWAVDGGYSGDVGVSGATCLAYGAGPAGRDPRVEAVCTHQHVPPCPRASKPAWWVLDRSPDRARQVEAVLPVFWLPA